MHILCFVSLFCLETTAFAFVLYTCHPLSVPQLTLNMILLLIKHNGKRYHESQVHVHVTYAIDTVLVKMSPLIFILHNVHVAALSLILTKTYEHKMCFRHNQKGNIKITCACANICLHLFGEESRGCSVLEMQTAQKDYKARGPTDKNNHIAISKVNSSLHKFASL